MKKIIIKSLKVLGIIFLLIVLFLSIVMYRFANYEELSIKIDKTKFSKINSPEDINNLAIRLVTEMSFEEKVDQMYGEKKVNVFPKMIANFLFKKRFPHFYVGGNERLNIPPWVLSDGPRGARVLANNVEAVTTFPVGMARGASWDTDLEANIHEVIAIEMRANKANYAATPCINLLRHPAWGRAQETYGEDPWLLGEFGVAAVKAIEKHNVMACPKHFALNSVDNSRFVVNVELDERTLREVYLPHFKKTIQKGRPASLMSAYNKVLGEYCGNNKYLLNDILRDEWGFEGFISTDWFNGAYDGVESVKAGLEVEMPWQSAYSYEAIKKGIEDGEISENDLDVLVTRSLKTRLKYLFAEDLMDYSNSKEIVLKPTHITLAKEAAEKSMVLIKNDNILPFKKNKNKKVAVIGRLANVENTGDQASSDCRPPYVITPYQGIKTYNERLGNEVVLNEGSDIESVIKLVKEVDEVVVVVGYTFKDEGEYIVTGTEGMEKSADAGKLVGRKGTGGDRDSLKLLPIDEDLIAAVSGINKNIVVVYVGGSAIDMNNWEPKIPAILFSWYAGMEGGNALANILYGDVNPSGKLTFSIPKDVKEYPYFTPYTNEIKYEYYHGYTLFDKKDIDVAYPFGFGLSYTTYQYANLKVIEPTISKRGKLMVSVDVSNTGEVIGEEIIQLYIGFKNSSVDRPIKLLRDFKKVEIASNETKNVILEVEAEDLAWYNPDTKKWEIESMEYEIYVGSSSAEKDLLMDSFNIK